MFSVSLTCVVALDSMWMLLSWLNKWYKSLVRLGGERKLDPLLDLVIRSGNLHFRKSIEIQVSCIDYNGTKCWIYEKKGPYTYFLSFWWIYGINDSYSHWSCCNWDIIYENHILLLLWFRTLVQNIIGKPTNDNVMAGLIEVPIVGLSGRPAKYM